MSCKITPSHFSDQDFLLLRGKVFISLLYQHVMDQALEPRLADEILIMLDATSEVIASAREANDKLHVGFKHLNATCNPN